METTIKTFAWFGLVVAALLSLGTLYFWALWLWENMLEKLPFPTGLYTATKVCVLLGLTKNKAAFVGHYVGAELERAEKESPEFKEALRWYRQESLSSPNVQDQPRGREPLT